MPGGKQQFVRQVDQVTKPMPVALTESSVPDSQPMPIKKISKTPTTETLLNASSVAAGGNTGSINLGITNEKRVWILINTDKQPWTTTVLPYVGGTHSSYCLYPRRSGVSTAYSAPTVPCISLLLGIPASDAIGLTPPTTMAEADLYKKPNAGQTITVTNNNPTDIATITVRIIREWE